MKKNLINIEIPSNYNDKVLEAIDIGLHSKKDSFYVRKISISLILIFSIFITLLNTVPVFAKTLYEIDGIGDICRFFTFREYKYEDNINYIDVKIPEFNYSNNSSLENRINLEINKVINEAYENAKKNAKEYYDAFVATGGKKEEFHPIKVLIDYKVYHMSSKMVSFKITKSESFASSYTNNYFYNIDLETGKNFTIKDWFGPDYKSIVANSIKKSINNWEKEQKEMLFLDNDIENIINENQSFYVNDKEQVVVVFQKYEIGAGALGQIEFVIEN